MIFLLHFTMSCDKKEAIYIGNVCNGKQRSKSAIDHTRIEVPREEWDIVHKENFRIISELRK